MHSAFTTTGLPLDSPEIPIAYPCQPDCSMLFLSGMVPGFGKTHSQKFLKGLNLTKAPKKRKRNDPKYAANLPGIFWPSR